MLSTLATRPRIVGAPLAGLAAMICAAAMADEAPESGAITYTKDVAPIMFANCIGCHRDGQIGPMSLASYNDVRPWAKSIREQVATGKMPPWHADPRYGKFTNDISLTAEQSRTILAWVDAGAPQGDPKLMPPLPEAPPEWQLGPPDYIVTLPKYDVPAKGPDEFPNLTVNLDIPDDKWLRAIEYKPSNTKVTHHMVLYAGEGGMTGGGAQDGLGGGAFGGWAVGSPPFVMPKGVGFEIGKQDKLTANMHYHPSGEAQTDQTRLGFYFGEGEIKKVVAGLAPLSLSFEIPPNDPDYVSRGTCLVEQDYYAFVYFPHMHTRGSAMKYTAHFPDGRDEILISVPHYDFNWQWNYFLEEPLFLPKGTVLEVEGHHDNSSANPNNPDPTKLLRFGEGTNDEMMIGAVAGYVAEGVRVQPPKLMDRIEEYLAKSDSNSLYRVKAPIGNVTLPMILDLPRPGKARWMLAMPGQIVHLAATEPAWDGDNFSFKLPMGEELGTITISGQLRADGKVANGRMLAVNVFGHQGDRGTRDVRWIAEPYKRGAAAEKKIGQAPGGVAGE